MYTPDIRWRAPRSKHTGARRKLHEHVVNDWHLSHPNQSNWSILTSHAHHAEKSHALFWLQVVLPPPHFCLCHFSRSNSSLINPVCVAVPTKWHKNHRSCHRTPVNKRKQGDCHLSQRKKVEEWAWRNVRVIQRIFTFFTRLYVEGYFKMAIVEENRRMGNEKKSSLVFIWQALLSCFGGPSF